MKRSSLTLGQLRSRLSFTLTLGLLFAISLILAFKGAKAGPLNEMDPTRVGKTYWGIDFL